MPRVNVALGTSESHTVNELDKPHSSLVIQKEKSKKDKLYH